MFALLFSISDSRVSLNLDDLSCSALSGFSSLSFASLRFSLVSHLTAQPESRHLSLPGPLQVEIKEDRKKINVHAHGLPQVFLHPSKRPANRPSRCPVCVPPARIKHGERIVEGEGIRDSEIRGIAVLGLWVIMFGVFNRRRRKIFRKIGRR
jgi:hypothetical protein